jgi:hypothetical protein
METETPDREHLHLLKDVSFRPVFIIGDHRSGTTLMHQLLAETGGFNFVTAYHVTKYPQILSDHLHQRAEAARQDLQRDFLKLGLKDRIIDNVPVTPDLPVEYGFVFTSRNNRRPKLTAQMLPQFVELCKKIQFIGEPTKPLLLKNPWDVLGFAEIKAYFPQARFVFIHRHPISVMNSQFRAVESLLAARNGFLAMLAPWYKRLYERPPQLFAVRLLSRWPFHLWERLLAVHMVRVADYFVEHIGSLGPTDYVSVTYEELCQGPDATMQRIAGFLGVSLQRKDSYCSRIEPRPPKLLSQVRRKYRQISQRLAPYLNYHGYEAEPAFLRQP